MRGLLNTMKLHAQQQVGQIATVRVGQVSSYDPGNYSAKVLLQPEGAETGWLPVMSQWVGNGWGLFSPPTPGDLVEVQFIDGDFTQGVVCLRFFNDLARPLNVPSGELWLVHKSGAYVKLTNDGKLSLSDGHGASIALNGDGTIASTGTWTHTGQFTASVDVIGGGKSLKTHTHSDPQGGNTGAPN